MTVANSLHTESEIVDANPRANLVSGLTPLVFNQYGVLFVTSTFM